ncbi:XRE family transcriptional regulator, partial [Escherichia coli]|nr:XRE family transcriptional regulator [Escherichia coli]
MEYMDWVELGMNKRARKMTRQDVAEAMGFKGKGAASHKFKGRRDTTNKTADDVFKMLAAVGWQAVIFDSNGKIVMGTAHVDSPDGMEQKFIKRCEELARENEALKAEIDMLKNQLNNKIDIVDKPVNQQIETKGDAIVGEPAKQQKAAGGRPAKFKVEQLEQWLKEQGGYKGTIDDLAL